jgi:hypothetical protein
MSYQIGGSMKKTGKVSLGNAVIWAAAILASAVVLRGTEFAGITVIILGGAAAASIALVASSKNGG